VCVGRVSRTRSSGRIKPPNRQGNERMFILENLGAITREETRVIWFLRPSFRLLFQHLCCWTDSSVLESLASPRDHERASRPKLVLFRRDVPLSPSIFFASVRSQRQLKAEVNSSTSLPLSPLTQSGTGSALSPSSCAAPPDNNSQLNFPIRRLFALSRCQTDDATSLFRPNPKSKILR